MVCHSVNRERMPTIRAYYSAEIFMQSCTEPDFDVGLSIACREHDVDKNLDEGVRHFSFAPLGLHLFVSVTHGSRRGLVSVAPPGLTLHRNITAAHTVGCWLSPLPGLTCMRRLKACATLKNRPIRT